MTGLTCMHYHVNCLWQVTYEIDLSCSKHIMEKYFHLGMYFPMGAQNLNLFSYFFHTDLLNLIFSLIVSKTISHDILKLHFHIYKNI